MPSRKSSTADRAIRAVAPGSPQANASRKASTARRPSDVAKPGKTAGATKPSARRRPQGELGLGWSAPALIAGVDEAGRGPLAGPVVAAAVILDELNPIEGLADSKVLTAKARERLSDEIRAKALCCSVAEASVQEIEEINILQATMLAMRRAVEGLRLKPGRVLVDGNRLPVLKVAAEAIIGGDATVQAISAASILAKVHRDRLCVELHERHPEYGFHEHKGYSTPEHLTALRQHGACAAHRRTFAPVREVIAASLLQTVTVETTTVDPFGGAALTITTVSIETATATLDGAELENLTIDVMTSSPSTAARLPLGPGLLDEPSIGV